MLLVWIFVILVIVVPWGRFQMHSHWQEVGWVPFITPPIRLRDVVLNALLYLPFGYWLTKSGARKSWLRTIGYALALSTGTELTQVFSHGRFPSATDVVCNVAGAAWGSGLARTRR